MIDYNKVNRLSAAPVLCRKDNPIYIQVLINLEYRLLLGYGMHRANGDVEKAWANELSTRLEHCLEKPTTYKTHLLCDYISSLQFDDFKTIQFSPDFKECIASIIKDYLLTYVELDEYKTYSQSFALQCEKR